LIGTPLAVWLTARRHLGLGEHGISPYLLPYYVQMLGWSWFSRVGVLGAGHRTAARRVRLASSIE
jgi:hypothetical protein